MALLWSNDKVMELIQLFRSKSVLWDFSRKEYKDKRKKNDAYEAIARVLNIPAKDVETKLHVLRTQFCREKKKMAAKKTLGIGEIDEKCKWVYYEPLQFLLHGANRTTSSGKSAGMAGRNSMPLPQQEIETITCDSPYDSQSTENTAVQNQVKHCIQSTREFTPSELHTRKRRRENYNNTNSALNKQDMYKSFLDDDLTAFGNYVVTTLRKFDARNCVEAQDEIYTILSNYKRRQLACREARASVAKLESPSHDNGW